MRKTTERRARSFHGGFGGNGSRRLRWDEDYGQSVVIGLFLSLACTILTVGALGVAIGLWSRAALSAAAQAGVEAAVAGGDPTTVATASVTYHSRTCDEVVSATTTYVPGGYWGWVNGQQRRLHWRTARTRVLRCRNGARRGSTFTVPRGTTAAAAEQALGCTATGDPAPQPGRWRVCTAASVSPTWSWVPLSPAAAEQMAEAYFYANANRALGPHTGLSLVSFSAALAGAGRVSMTVRATEPWNPLSLLMGHVVTVTTTATAWPEAGR